MIVCLSSSFLRRIRLQWKPDLRGFIIGDRNLHFFYPDSLVEVPEITPESVDEFLAQHKDEATQLLGFIASSELPLIPGYAELHHGGQKDPSRWKASLNWLGDHGEERRELEIKISAD
jgi:hypothetical protein